MTEAQAETLVALGVLAEPLPGAGA